MKLEPNQRAKAEEMIKEIRKSFPSESSRRARLLKEFKMFKGHEFYILLSHTGWALFEMFEQFSEDDFWGDVYEMYRNLSFFARIAYNDQLCRETEWNTMMNELLDTYLDRLYTKFGFEGHCKYNGHVAKHIAQFCKERGSVRNFDTSGNESYMKHIKDNIRVHNHLILSILVNRELELRSIIDPVLIQPKYRLRKPIKNESGSYWNLFINDIVLKADERDGYILTSGERPRLCRIKKFTSTATGNIRVEVNAYHADFLTDFHPQHLPMRSGRLNVFVAENFSQARVFPYVINVSKIACKFAKTPTYRNDRYCFTTMSPFEHSIN